MRRRCLWRFHRQRCNEPIRCVLHALPRAPIGICQVGTALSKPHRITFPLIFAPVLAACVAILPALAEPARQGAQPAVPGAARSAAPPAGAAGDAGLKQRVEQLEEQLVDMQVVIGTLELLARGGATAAASGGARSDGGGGGAADVRLDGLETQVRALAAQIEQLTQQVHALSATPRRSEAAPVPPAAGAAPTATTATAVPRRALPMSTASARRP